jgi:mRNA interferase MazF
VTEYIKQFNAWNERKKHADGKSISEDFFFHEREVWWCAVGVNIGAEIDGKNDDFERPILVIRKFNRDMFWGVPLTSKEKSHPAYVAITHDKGVSYANMTQLRTWSTKRLLRKVGMVSLGSFTVVVTKLQELITIEPHRGGGVLGGRSH